MHSARQDNVLTSPSVKVGSIALERARRGIAQFVTEKQLKMVLYFRKKKLYKYA